MSVKRADLEHLVNRLNRCGVEVALDWAYGKPRLTTLRWEINISPRLSLKEMQLWLNAFEDGVHYGRIHPESEVKKWA